MEEEDWFDLSLVDLAFTEEPPYPQTVILVMGLDGSGKTALMSSMSTDLIEETPYCHNGVHLLLRELGGRFRFREYWYANLQHSRGLIWVVDSIDRGRILESKEEFEGLLGRPELAGAPVLLVLNKGDSEGKMETTQVLAWFNVGRYGDRKVTHVETSKQACSDLLDGVTWLVGELGLEPEPAAGQEDGGDGGAEGE
jgi:GTPase SAR1 family protein